MIEQSVIQDIKTQSLVIWETLTKSISYKVAEITLQYSETIDLIISSNLEGIVVRVYVDEEGSHPCMTNVYLEYRDNKWIDENE